jgi:PAS domain S-box-containing protein
VITWDIDGNIREMNPAAESLYGLSAAQGRSMKIAALNPESREQFAEAEETLLGGADEVVLNTRLQRTEGEVIIEQRIVLLPARTGRPGRFASIARDVSQIAYLQRATAILAGTDRSSRRASDFPYSPPMRQVIDIAETAAAHPTATILLLGETGVGKGWLARRIHSKSPRAEHPFLEINCAGLAPQLVESELFGYERGAFTGATTQKAGLVEVAARGSLFLDEIGELPPNVQAQLLTFLDSQTFRRVGGTRNLTGNVRIIAATNLDLRQMSDRGTFRKDLYFRLSVIPVRVPPLRERREEISPLASVMLRIIGKRDLHLSEEVIEALRGYDWPGNVRELRNALERALILSGGKPIELHHLPPEISEGAPVDLTEATGTPSSERRGSLDDVEIEHIRRVLQETGNNQTRAAKLLGISRSTLIRKLRQLSRRG